MNNSFYTLESKLPIKVINAIMEKSSQNVFNRLTTLKVPNTAALVHVRTDWEKDYYKLYMFCASCEEELENRHQRLVGYHGRCFNK
jgi:hypothetical protein